MKLPNIVFLDMDGVLCTPRACHAVGQNGLFSYLDPIACMLLKRLCVETNSKLVISSAWRIGRTLEQFRDILNAACPGLGLFIWNHEDNWRTGRYASNRGNEIKCWIDLHDTQFDRFVILDDDSDMEPLMNSFVKCDCYDGFGLHGLIY